MGTQKTTPIPARRKSPYRTIQVAAGTYDEDMVVRGTSIQNCTVGLQAGDFTSASMGRDKRKKGQIQLIVVSGPFFNQST